MASGLASLTGSLATVETRPVFLGIGLIGRMLFYLASTLSIVAFSYGWWRRVAKYRRGRPAGRGAFIWQGLLRRPVSDVRGGGDSYGVAAIAAGSSVGRRYRATGIAHFFIFWGFILLFLGTVILTIDVDILRNVSRWMFGHEDSFFHGPFYLGYKVVLNTFGLLAVVALAFMMVRRGIARPHQLDYTRAERPESGYSRVKLVVGDWIFVSLFMLILLTGFAIETLRIVEEGFPSFEKWSWLGYAAGRATQAVGLGKGQAADAHAVVWWIHAVLALLFVAYIPYSKAMHMLVDGVNLLAHDRRGTRNLPAPAPADHAGYATIADFTWKELLDLDSCTKCGRCHEVCPARTAGAPLSPRDVILDLRQWVDTQSKGLTLFDREQRPAATGPLAPGAGSLIAGGVISDRALWSCTTCMACVEICPVGIEHVSTIVQMRRALVDAGTMDPTLQSALQNLGTQGNSFGKSSRMRARWTRTLDFTIADARTEKVRYLWFVGDYASFDDRLQENSRVLARILHDAGVDFGILYDGEWNSGNDVRRVGEEGLFDLLAEHNIAALQSAQFDEIFTTDPHSLNTLRNEYPERGARYKVWHHTELLANLLESGQIPVNPLDLTVTYHDPCYLARYNQVLEAPRRVLAALGCTLKEMPRNRSNTFCCGAGGGRIWMDDSYLTERPSENRIKEAVALDVEHFVVSCPKDMTMYSDAAKTTGNDERLTVHDIIALVDRARVQTSPPSDAEEMVSA